MKNLDVAAIVYQKRSKYPYLMDSHEFDFFQKITNLEVSAGAVVVSNSPKSAVFVDGRYKLAAKLMIDVDKFDIMDLHFSCIKKWILNNIAPGESIGYDPKFFSLEEMKKMKDLNALYNLKRIDLEHAMKTASLLRKMNFYHMPFQNSSERIKHVLQIIEKNDLNAYLICDPCSICWLLNIRDLNSRHSMVVFGYLLVGKMGELILYIDDRYSCIPQQLCDNANLCLDVKYEKDLAKDIVEYKFIGIDESETPAHLQHENFVHLKNPCLLPKAIKSAEEISHIKNVAKQDSMAINDFMRWIYINRDRGIDELQASEKLLYFRRLRRDFICESFPTIMAADEHSAVVHYSPNASSNKSIKNILLFDSGGQYRHGTTDITRTICLGTPSGEQRLFYTMVLKGHIAVANARVPVGTIGACLDTLARQFLWKYSADYNHGTGHGIGYMLHVHEGPMSLAKTGTIPLMNGMLLSNEPGYYLENSFGIRLENMILAKENSDGFISFETVSFVPFEEKLIDRTLLDACEINWLNEYHQHCEILCSSKDL